MILESSKHSHSRMNFLRHALEWALSFAFQIFVGVFAYIKILTGLLLVDMVIGILAAIKRGEDISLRRMMPTFLKMIAVVVLLPAFFHYENVFEVTEDHKATAFLASIIGAVQLFSMDKHFLTLFGFSFWSVISARFPVLDTLLKAKNGDTEDTNKPTK